MRRIIVNSSGMRQFAAVGVVIGLVFVLGGAPDAQGQGSAMGVILGTVTDPMGAVVAGA